MIPAGCNEPEPVKIDVLFDDQHFRCVEVVAHVRRDGTATSYQIMASDCATCGMPYTFTWSPAGRFKPTRRCADHRQPFTRVRKVYGRHRQRPVVPIFIEREVAK